MKKVWRQLNYDEKVVNHLQEVLNIHPLFCRMLAQRGISTYEEAKAFFRPSLTQLHDPFLMKDMRLAVDRILLAIQKKERILLYGDYDADGTTAVALLHEYLSQHTPNLIYYLPDRYKEGYGISFEGIDFAYQQQATVLIALDCGITAQAAVRAANYYGIDCIICDHHLPEAELPEAHAILNPKQADCTYPYKELSGCGVAFKLAQGIQQQLNRPFDNLVPLLDFLAISIAADIVNVMGENRVLLHFGLEQLNVSERPGIQAILQHKSLRIPLRVRDVVFGIAPLINAAGRLADAAQAVRLLLAKTDHEAQDALRALHLRNEMRKEYEQRILQEAETMLEADVKLEDRAVIVLYQKHWHKGVLGIVASKLVEQYHRPVLLLAESDGKLSGSARSVQHIDIHAALSECTNVLTNFGGHRHAAGVQLETHQLFFLESRLEIAIRQQMEVSALPILEYVGELKLQALSFAFYNLIQEFAPFGPGNRSPLFISRGVVADKSSRVLKGKHLKMWLKQDQSATVGGIGFGLADHYEAIVDGQPFEICYKVEINNWKEKQYLQIVAKSIKPSAT
jgi:single-stranded-DNA-specific exonuclease